jgi:hypothetical protein
MATENKVTVDKNFLKILEECTFVKNGSRFDIKRGDENIRLLIKLNKCQLSTYIHDKKLGSISTIGYIPIGTSSIHTSSITIKDTLEKISNIFKKTVPAAFVKNNLSYRSHFKCHLQKKVNDNLLKALEEKYPNVSLGYTFIRVLLENCTLSVTIKSTIGRYSNTYYYYYYYNIMDFGQILSTNPAPSPTDFTEFSSIHVTIEVIEKSKTKKKFVKNKSVSMVIEI